MVNGILSTMSDNVFVATIFIEGVARAYHEGKRELAVASATNSTMAHAVISDEQFSRLAIAINMVFLCPRRSHECSGS